MRISSSFCLLFIWLNSAAFNIFAGSYELYWDLLKTETEDYNINPDFSYGPQAEYFNKETAFGSIEYREGDLVFNPMREMVGIINKIYKEGVVFVQYKLEDQRPIPTIYLEESNNIHKKLAVVEIKENGRIFFVGERVKVKKSKKIAIIKYFYDNGLIHLVYLRSSGDEQFSDVFIDQIKAIKTNKRKNKTFCGILVK